MGSFRMVYDSAVDRENRHRLELGAGFCGAGVPSRRCGFRVKDARHEAFAATLRPGGRPGIRATRRSG